MKYLIDTDIETNQRIEADSPAAAAMIAEGNQILSILPLKSLGTSEGTSNRAFDRAYYTPSHQVDSRQTSAAEREMMEFETRFVDLIS